ncbi:MAG: tryptophan synthase subunit beta like protein [Deltaproteobacteria bacterium]|nr:tryptophan synthase subunit beta like protein [Deltaproteobacteria bacterium]
MLYVERDGEGRIIAMHSAPKPNASEEKTVVDEEILDFLNKTVSADSRKLLLSLSDMGIIRLLEDLIDLLIQKNVIFYTELPESAQDKIRERKRLRETVNPQTLTVDDII